MHLVDPKGRRPGDHRAPLTHPCLVAPQVVDCRRHHTGITRGSLGLASHRVGLGEGSPVFGDDLELVAVRGSRRRSDGRPDSRHGIDASERLSRPVVPIADHRDRDGVRSPHGESYTSDQTVGADVQWLRAEQLPETPVRAFAEQMEVEITDRARDVGHRRPG